MGRFPFSRRRPETVATPRHRLKIQGSTVIYAIGDVHGRLDLLLRLEAQILRDARSFFGRTLLVLLGDYVDRGPNSRGVIEHLATRALPSDIDVVCLAGNHDVAMHEFVLEPRSFPRWAALGAEDTLLSYGVDPALIDRISDDPQRWAASALDAIPMPHRAFLASLPILLESPDFIFVHAGLRPGRALEDQLDEDLVWIRREFLDADPGVRTIVHGHTPFERPDVVPGRIGIDTGAVWSSRLTAVRLASGYPPHFLST